MLSLSHQSVPIPYIIQPPGIVVGEESLLSRELEPIRDKDSQIKKNNLKEVRIARSSVTVSDLYSLFKAQLQ
jgi:hypothetical protein